jgi:hypothetical protein
MNAERQKLSLRWILRRFNQTTIPKTISFCEADPFLLTEAAAAPRLHFSTGDLLKPPHVIGRHRPAANSHKRILSPAGNNHACHESRHRSRPSNASTR